MNSGPDADPSTNRTSQRLVDRLLDGFEQRNHFIGNRLLLVPAIPFLVWSGFAVLTSLPVPASLAVVPGLDWAILAACVVSAAYAALSLRLGVAMFALSAIMIAVARYYTHDDTMPLWQPAIVFFILGVLLWLVGRRFEGRPKLLGEMMRDLLIAPAWLLASILRLLRIGY